MKTTSQVLLAGVRRGKFSTLLALADHWQETREYHYHAAQWEKLLGNAQWQVANPTRNLAHFGARDAIALWFRDFAYAINRVEKCWRLPKHRKSIHPHNNLNHWPAGYGEAWRWCRRMADALIRYVRLTGGPVEATRMEAE